MLGEVGPQADCRRQRTESFASPRSAGALFAELRRRVTPLRPRCSAAFPFFQLLPSNDDRDMNIAIGESAGRQEAWRTMMGSVTLRRAGLRGKRG